MYLTLVFNTKEGKRFRPKYSLFPDKLGFIGHIRQNEKESTMLKRTYLRGQIDDQSDKYIEEILWNVGLIERNQNELLANRPVDANQNLLVEIYKKYLIFCTRDSGTVPLLITAENDTLFNPFAREQ
jgi:hypothetical protein